MGRPKNTMRPLENRVSIAEAAADRIREAILRGTYQQGERLSDLHIAEELETSRGPIREALKLLQAQGLVVQKPHRGTFVIRVSADDIRDTCGLRVAFESYAVRALARQPREADILALRRLLDKMNTAAAHGDKLRVSQLDRDFHDLLCLLGGGRRLHEVYEREVLNTLGFFGVDSQAYQPISDMGVEFGPLLVAIEAGDEDAAAHLIEAHVRRACSLLSTGLEATPGTSEIDSRPAVD
jgi:GntR family transcriptional regulator, gluconate operon transcriptional repressor